MDYDAMMLDTEAAGPVVKIPMVSTREAKSFMKARLTRNVTDCAALGRFRTIKRRFGFRKLDTPCHHG
jgi:hypothetical protein